MQYHGRHGNVRGGSRHYRSVQREYTGILQNRTGMQLYEFQPWLQQVQQALAEPPATAILDGCSLTAATGLKCLAIYSWLGCHVRC